MVEPARPDAPLELSQGKVSVALEVVELDVGSHNGVASEVAVCVEVLVGDRGLPAEQPLARDAEPLSGL